MADETKTEETTPEATAAQLATQGEFEKAEKAWFEEKFGLSDTEGFEEMQPAAAPTEAAAPDQGETAPETPEAEPEEAAEGVDVEPAEEEDPELKAARPFLLRDGILLADTEGWSRERILAQAAKSRDRQMHGDRAASELGELRKLKETTESQTEPSDTSSGVPAGEPVSVNLDSVVEPFGDLLDDDQKAAFKTAFGSVFQSQIQPIQAENVTLRNAVEQMMIRDAQRDLAADGCPEIATQDGLKRVLERAKKLNAEHYSGYPDLLHDAYSLEFGIKDEASPPTDKSKARTQRNAKPSRGGRRSAPKPTTPEDKEQAWFNTAWDGTFGSAD